MTDTAPRPSVTSSMAWPKRALLLARDAVWSIVDEFLIDAVRDGRIRLKGRTPAMRTVVIVVAVILAVTFVSFASGDLFRTGRDLLVLPSGRAGRGTLFPEWLVPVTFFLLTVSLALVLAGSLHAALAVRIPALLFGVLIPATFMANAHAGRSLSSLSLWPGWVALAAIPVVFAARWRAEPRPAPEFVGILVLLTATFGVAAAAVAQVDAATGTGSALGLLQILVVQLTALAYPLVYVAGLDVLTFGLDASSWSLRFVDRRIGPTAVVVGVAALGLWRVRDTLVRLADEVGDSGAYDTFMPIVGAAILVAVIGAWWAGIRRLAGWGPGTRPGEDTVEHSSTRLRLWLGGAFSLTLLLQVPVLLVLQVLVQMGWTGLGMFERIADVRDVLYDDDLVTAYRILLGLTLVGLGVHEARKARPAVALLVGTIGLTTLMTELYVTGPFDDLYWAGPEAIDTVWLAVFVGVTAWWMTHRRFTGVRRERILFALVLGALVAQFDFVTDPFSPFLGFTGVGFVAFGLAWGFLTGGGVADRTTPGFSRSTRTYLYLGYALLSIALLNWATVAHDLAAQENIASTGQDGADVLGFPVIYAVFALTLAGAVTNRPVDDDRVAPTAPAEGVAA